jgi:hypothetical protein
MIFRWTEADTENLKKLGDDCKAHYKHTHFEEYTMMMISGIDESSYFIKGKDLPKYFKFMIARVGDEGLFVDT